MGETTAVVGTPGGTGPSVELLGVTLTRGDRTVLMVDELRLGPGITALVGPNGSGKSTLLHTVAGLITPARGSVSVLGRAPREARRAVAYVLQTQETSRQLLVTAREVVSLARAATLGPFRRPGRADRRAVDRALERLELADLADHHLAEMSGGQRQRVFIAQGLAQDAAILLLDEPLAGLDLASAQRIRAVIADERAAGRTVVVATHDLDEASRADHVVMLAGRVVAAGPPGQVLLADVLREAYGARVLDLGATTVALDDGAHHHH